MIQNSKTVTAERHTLFRVSAGTTIDFEAMAYFAASVIWRATIHKWSDGPQITLGKVYEEQFRRYLMGEEFPEDAVVLIDLARVEDRLQNFFGGVMTAKYERYRQHAFFAPGVIFEIAVGRLIPPLCPASLCIALARDPFKQSRSTLPRSLQGNDRIVTRTTLSGTDLFGFAPRIEGEDLIDLMNGHRSNDSRIVDLNPIDSVVKHQLSPSWENLRRLKASLNFGWEFQCNCHHALFKLPTASPT